MDHLRHFRTWFKYGALACTVFSAGLTFVFGWHQNPNIFLALLCAGFLVVCSVSSDYVFLFVHDAIKRREWGRVVYLTGGALFVFSLNVVSNLGSVGWQRDVTLSQARVVNTRADMAQERVADEKASVAAWTKRLSEMEAANAWLPTVTASALRAELPAVEEAIAQEARRVRCGPKCLALKEKKADIEGRIALAEERATLAGKIEKTKAILAQSRTRLASAERTVAAPESQAKFFASMVSLNLAPSSEAETWTLRWLSVLIALGLCVVPIILGLAGWRSEDTEPEAPARRDTTALAIPKSASETWAAALNRRCAARSVIPPKLITA